MGLAAYFKLPKAASSLDMIFDLSQGCQRSIEALATTRTTMQGSRGQFDLTRPSNHVQRQRTFRRAGAILGNHTANLITMVWCRSKGPAVLQNLSPGSCLLGQIHVAMKTDVSVH